MSTCPFCGKQTQEGAAFCLHCGAVMNAPQKQPQNHSAAQPPQEPSLFGTPGGTPAQEPSLFGTPGETPAQPQWEQPAAQPSAPAPKQKSGNKPLVIVISVLLALLLISGGVIAWIIISGKDGGEEEESRSARPHEAAEEAEPTEHAAAEEQSKPTEPAEPAESTELPSEEPASEEPAGAESADLSDLTFGLLCLHDPSESTYDERFNTGLYSLDEFKELSVVININEDSSCYSAARSFASDGCNMVFSDSIGHESYMLDAAKEFPDVHFVALTGQEAKNAGLPNFHNGGIAMHDGWYLGGIAAGMKLNEMIANGEIRADEANLGYVGSFPYAECISAYTAWYLGAKSVCPAATVTVCFTNAWFAPSEERYAAEKLLSNGCKILSQYSDSESCPQLCEERGVPNVGYGFNNLAAAPTTMLLAVQPEWGPLFQQFADDLAAGRVAVDYVGTLEEGCVGISEVNGQIAAAGTAEAIEEAKRELIAGTRHTFDTASFTVNGSRLDSYYADVIPDGAFTPDTDVITDGYFAECEFRSTPYFDLKVDGVTFLDN